ncbi:hypothetical protein [Fluviispira multicolorata]|uniref:Uncharacterized protein n=1 Tax=Fluviispira multicolorata TaxID=2654512 RepID=A0A833N6L0_9BACT|nr:hypothetical protein [Fluviispira multicolorata]KAB8033610.1 hypothetical protein GCL57_02565 [Fluviispira multicolorata]
MFSKKLFKIFMAMFFGSFNIYAYSDYAYTYCVTEDGDWDLLYDYFQKERIEEISYLHLSNPFYTEKKENIVNGEWTSTSVKGDFTYVFLPYEKENKIKSLEERCKNEVSKYKKKYIYAQPMFYYFGFIPSGYALFGKNNNENLSLSNGYLPDRIAFDHMNSFIIVPKKSNDYFN